MEQVWHLQIVDIDRGKGTFRHIDLSDFWGRHFFWGFCRFEEGRFGDDGGEFFGGGNRDGVRRKEVRQGDDFSEFGFDSRGRHCVGWDFFR